MAAIIYLVTNTVNGKQYVGYTTQPINKRVKAHRHLAKKGSQGALQRAIRKYGWGNFDVDVIFEHDDIQWTKDTMEPYFIDWYGTYEGGYNLTLGGEGVLGLVLSDSTKQKLSEAATQQWENADRSDMGRRISEGITEDGKRKISEATSTPIMAIAPDKTTMTFRSIKACGEYLERTTGMRFERRRIAEVAQQAYGHKSYHGYAFKYLSPKRRSKPRSS